ncbi:MAG: hypothetical protein EBR30_28760, partial [Cytophagia bacterium]|nr:hypothetical protein [Cytophagia bacterium]
SLGIELVSNRTMWRNSRMTACSNCDMVDVFQLQTGGETTSVEELLRYMNQQSVGFSISGEKIASTNSQFEMASSVVKSIEKVKGGLKINFTFTGKVALAAAQNVSVPNGAIFMLNNEILKNGTEVLRVSSSESTLYDEPFNILINDNTYSFKGIQFFPIFPKK